MATRPRSSLSFFGGGRVPCASAELSSDPGDRAIPFAISFCKAEKISHFLAVADEDGYVGLYDTSRRLPSSSSSLEKSAETKMSDWVAHNNAIFDVCWIKVKIWTVENKNCLMRFI